MVWYVVVTFLYQGTVPSDVEFRVGIKSEKSDLETYLSSRFFQWKNCRQM